MSHEKQARQKTTGRAQLAVHVCVLWERTQLSVLDMAAATALWLGDGSGGPVDAIVPAEMLGAARAPLVVRDAEGRMLLALLPQAKLIRAPADPLVEQASGELDAPAGTRWLELSMETTAEVQYGQLRFRIETHSTVAPLPRLEAVGRRLAALLVLSMLLHAAAATMCWLDAPASVDAYGLTDAQHAMVQRYLLRIDSDEGKWLEAMALEAGPSEVERDDREGGTGVRAKGEEGSMAPPSLSWRRSNVRYGLAGPSTGRSRGSGIGYGSGAGFGSGFGHGSGAGRSASAKRGGHSDPRARRQTALRDAAEFGVVGMLNAGAGNQWGGSLDSSHRGGSGYPPQVDGRQSRHGLPALAPIDPNGRFSTTYRPGGGHLAAFDAALSRGVVPLATRELVGDVAAAHAPQVAIASDRALGVAVALERTKLPPTGGPTHLRIALRSTPRGAARRPQLSVHLLLDVSGSMQGPSIKQAKRAAHRLVRMLAPTDVLSLVAFASDARLAVAPGPIRGRSSQIHRAIDGLEADGSTNIGAGLELIYLQALLSRRAKRASLVMVLSDGRATAGTVHFQSLATMALQAFQEGVQTSALGLGSDYDEQLMSSIAADGAGGYYYLRDADQIGGAMHKEIAQRLNPAATALELRVRLAEGVELLHVYGARRLGQQQAGRERAKEIAADRHAERRLGIARDRQQDRSGGMRFFIPSFARADSHALLVQVRAPAGETRRRLGTVELKYKDHVYGQNRSEELPIWADYAVADAASAQSIDASVARTVQAHLAGEDLMRSAQLLSRGKPSAAGAVLSERQKILREAADSLGDRSLLVASHRLARLRLVAEAGAGMDPLARSLVLRTAARSHLR